MAEVALTSNQYTNLHVGSGITTGSPLHIQNKSAYPVYLQNVASQPAGSSTAGFVLLPFEDCTVEGTVTVVWARSASASGSVFVELVA